MAFSLSFVVDRASRSPTIPIRPGVHAPFFRTSTFSPASTVSVIRRMSPAAVR